MISDRLYFDKKVRGRGSGGVPSIATEFHFPIGSRPGDNIVGALYFIHIPKIFPEFSMTITSLGTYSAYTNYAKKRYTMSDIYTIFLTNLFTSYIRRSPEIRYVILCL